MTKAVRMSQLVVSQVDNPTTESNLGVPLTKLTAIAMVASKATCRQLLHYVQVDLSRFSIVSSCSISSGVPNSSCLSGVFSYNSIRAESSFSTSTSS